MANGQPISSKGWYQSAAGDAKPDLEGHLVVRHFAVLDVTTGVDNLEPFQVLDAFIGLGQCITDGVFYAARGRAYQFDFFVGVMIRQNVLLCRKSKPSSESAEYFVIDSKGKVQVFCTF